MNERLGNSRQRSHCLRAGRHRRAPRTRAAARTLGQLGRARARNRREDPQPLGGGGRPPARADRHRRSPRWRKSSFVVGGGRGGSRCQGRPAGRAERAPRRAGGACLDDLLAVGGAPRRGLGPPGAVRGPARVQPGDAHEARGARVPEGSFGGDPQRARSRCARPSRRPPSRFPTCPGSSSTGCCSPTCSTRCACSKRPAWSRRTSTPA